MKMGYCIKKMEEDKYEEILDKIPTKIVKMKKIDY